MRTRSKLLIAAISAIALLGIAIGAASARDLEVRNSANGFRIAWNPLHLEAAGREMACPVTLEGTFERGTFVKTTATRVGRVTGATVGACTRNTVIFLRETLPWEVNYSSFTGTLPNITSVSLNIIRASFRVNLEGIECLAQTRTEQPTGGIATIEASGAVTGFRADETRSIETAGGFFCSFGGRARFAGSASSIANRAGTESIGIRLIGEGESSPATLTPSPIEFGRVEPEELAKRTVTITAGTTAITVNRISVVSGNFFAITDPNRCVGARLAERGTCAFKVIFAAPGEAGRALSDTVRVETTERTLEDTVRGST